MIVASICVRYVCNALSRRSKSGSVEAHSGVAEAAASGLKIHKKNGNKPAIQTFHCANDGLD